VDEYDENGEMVFIALPPPPPPSRRSEIDDTEQKKVSSHDTARTQTIHSGGDDGGDSASGGVKMLSDHFVMSLIPRCISENARYVSTLKHEGVRCSDGTQSGCLCRSLDQSSTYISGNRSVTEPLLAQNEQGGIKVALLTQPVEEARKEPLVIDLTED
jgi:hypothetical protein